jgi:hypothetical protein
LDLATPNDAPPAAWGEFTTDEPRLAVLRAALLGAYNERAATFRERRSSELGEDPQTFFPGLDPTLSSLLVSSSAEDRLPDVLRLHAYAQAALLSAIRRAADSAEDPSEIRLLADAYLTLPSPMEDNFGPE